MWEGEGKKVLERSSGGVGEASGGEISGERTREGAVAGDFGESSARFRRAWRWGEEENKKRVAKCVISWIFH
jgi:hypothetical protein